jgi:ArsR family transcriptional regulator, lead/cadmium/zinc/bismuth-responsive transcriptional repressor
MNDRNDDLCGFPCFKKELVARVRASLPSDDELEDARVIFAALADKTRLKVLHVLRTGEELCVCDVAHVLDMSVSVASHHLRKLRDLRILKYRNDGKMAYYSLRDRFVGDLVKRALTKVAA